jgi:hypothetical protein
MQPEKTKEVFHFKLFQVEFGLEHDGWPRVLLRLIFNGLKDNYAFIIYLKWLKIGGIKSFRDQNP